MGGFDEFMAARWSALFHLARLFTGGDRHRAEDLLQEALVKLWFAWPRIADQAPEAYVRKVLARAAARSARRRWWGERPVEQLPELPAAGDVSVAVAERSRLEAALSQLPALQRAPVVLRYLPGPAGGAGRGGAGVPARHRPVPRGTGRGGAAPDPVRRCRASGLKEKRWTTSSAC
jgi:DNA-directed RNA polymerase specialized sigma24 family protein